LIEELREGKRRTKEVAQQDWAQYAFEIRRRQESRLAVVEGTDLDLGKSRQREAESRAIRETSLKVQVIVVKVRARRRSEKGENRLRKVGLEK